MECSDWGCTGGLFFIVYRKVKLAGLEAYELVPEASRQPLRNWKKGVKPYLYSGCDLVFHFNRWCSAWDVKGFDDLWDLF